MFETDPEKNTMFALKPFIFMILLLSSTGTFKHFWIF